MAEPAGAELFLAGLAGFDEGVCGETELAVLVSGGSIGSGKLVVEKAADGSGGVYRVAIELELAMGPMKMSIREVSILDEKFALVSSESRKVAD